MERTLKAFERHRDVILSWTRSLRRMRWVTAALRCQATSAQWRDPRAQVFPGADALRAVRAGSSVRNFRRAL